MMSENTQLKLISRDNPDCPEHPIPRWLLHDLFQQLNIFGLAEEHLKDTLQPIFDRNPGLNETWQSMCGAIQTQETLLRQLRQFLSMRSCARPLPLETVTLASIAARITIQFDKHPSSGKLICEGFSSRGVLSNSHCLIELLSCLVDNALTHGGNLVRLAAHEVPDGTRIDIENNGEGIDPALTEFLGMPFMRVPRQSSSRRGLGLGLHMAAKHAERLGHSLELRNTPGEGCQFSLTLKNSEGDDQVTTVDKCDPINGAHILIMDQNIRHGQEVHKLLTQWNCHSDYSSEKSETLLDKARIGVYDVIFVSKAIWLSATQNTSTPWNMNTAPGVRIFVMTDQKSDLEALSLIFPTDSTHDYLLYPISPSRLRSILGETLRHRETSLDG